MNKSETSDDLFEASYTCYIWNVRILPVIPGIYDDLFTFAYEQEGIKIKGKNEMRVKSINTGMEDLVFGELVLYSRDKHIDVFNIRAKEVEHASIGEDRYLYPKVARFFFVPSKHRLCLEKGTGIGLEAAETYIKKLLTSYIEHKGLKGQHVPKIDTQKSPSSLQDILSYNDRWKIKTCISFTNDDMTEDFDKILDDSIKKAGATNLSLEASSETLVPLQPKGTILEGALKLAQSNGEAIIYRGTRRKNKGYSTNEHVQTVQFNETLEELPFAIRKFILEMLKDNEDDNTNQPLRNEGDHPSIQRDEMED